MVEISEDQKFSILLTELQERYNSSHKIRERSTQFILTISGMGIGLGWILISQRTLIPSQRIAVSILILVLSMGTFYFLTGLQRGFQKNREAMINCEKALGMHEADIFLSQIPLLPQEYNRINRKWGDHFYTLYVWIILLGISLMMLTWTCTISEKNVQASIKTQQTIGGNK